MSLRENTSSPKFNALSQQTTFTSRQLVRQEVSRPDYRNPKSVSRSSYCCTKKTAEEIEIAKTVTPSLAKLNRLRRWMTLLTASHALYNEVIEEVHGNDVNRDGYE